MTNQASGEAIARVFALIAAGRYDAQQATDSLETR